MQETLLLGLNYNKKGKQTALAKSTIKNRFFINLLAISSIPFAIIMVAGKTKNKSSTPFLLGTMSANKTPTDRFSIKRSQLFLKELFIDSAFGDFTIRERRESPRMLNVVQ